MKADSQSRSHPNCLMASEARVTYIERHRLTNRNPIQKNRYKRSLMEKVGLNSAEEGREKVEGVSLVCEADQHRSMNIKSLIKITYVNNTWWSLLSYHKKQRPSLDSNEVENVTIHMEDLELPSLKAKFPIYQSDSENNCWQPADRDSSKNCPGLHINIRRRSDTKLLSMAS